MNSSSKSYLITGCAGFVGSNLVRYLLDNGQQVFGIDNLKTGSINNLKDCSGFKWEFGDIRSKALLQDIFHTRKFDYVIHLADSHLEENCWDVNVIGTNTLMTTALTHNIKTFINQIDLKSFSRQKNTAFECSKYAQYLVGLSFVSRNLNVITTLPSVSFGPKQSFSRDNLAKLIHSISLTGGIGLSKDTEESFLPIEDLCKALYLITDKGQPGSVYTISNTNNTTSYDEISKKIGKLLGKRKVHIGIDARNSSKNTTNYHKFELNDSSLSDNKLTTDTGFEFSFTLDDYLKKTIDWYKENKLI